ncbi:MAG: thermonuclease family protein [Rhizobium sp.]|nr:thermonuclease family protein [Rhizobium sp.]
MRKGFVFEVGENVAVRGRRIRDAVVITACLFLALLIIARMENEQAVRSRGPFSVIDGDTLAKAGRRLRLAGIDAPELGQMCERKSAAYDCGLAARARLIVLLKDPTVECFGGASDEDRYGRALVHCRSGTLDIGQKMVRVGLAVADGDYHMAERDAWDAGLGVWAGAFERPEDWRRRQALEAKEPSGWLQTFLSWLTAGWFER